MTPENAKSILKKHNVEADGKHLFNAFGNIELLEALLVAGADANHGANPDTPSSVSGFANPSFSRSRPLKKASTVSSGR